MRVWVVKIGEPLPIDKGEVRLMRSGLICESLAKKGHEVVWWTSTYNHYQKKHRGLADFEVICEDGYKINLLHSLGYKKNISFRRFIDHILLAKKFKRLVLQEKKPDLILCSLPTIELSCQAVKYGEKFNVPVVVDLRDMWPDIFVETVPFYIRWLAKIILYSKFTEMRYLCSHAEALFAITDNFLEWGLSYAKRKKGPSDKVFPFAYPLVVPDARLIESAYSYWQGKGINRNSNEVIVAYVGSLNKVHEDEVGFIIRTIQSLNLSIKLIVAGCGDKFEKYRQMANNSQNIIFTGWIDKNKIWVLLRLSSLGIIPYKNRFDYMSAIPNKFTEYLSAGLPILTNLKGAARELIDKSGCGLFYEDNNKETFIAALKDIISNRKKLKEMSKNAHALYERELVAENVYSDMVDHLEKIAKSV